MLVVPGDVGLLLDLASAPLEIGAEVSRVSALVGAGDDPGGVCEEVVHLLEGQVLGLGQDGPEPEGVGEVADDKEEVVAPANVLYGKISNLGDHGVEGERDHGGDGHALGPRVRVKDLGRDDPAERAARRREGDVVQPRHHDEAPAGLTSGEQGDQDRGDGEHEAVEEVAADEGPAAADPVDEQHARRLRQQRQDVVDGLVLERVLPADADLRVDVDTEVLDR